MNNAIIKMNLNTLLEVMDARTIIEVSSGINEHLCPMKVYEFISEPTLMAKYGNRNVIGLARFINTTSILVEEN